MTTLAVDMTTLAVFMDAAAEREGPERGQCAYPVMRCFPKASATLSAWFDALPVAQREAICSDSDVLKWVELAADAAGGVRCYAPQYCGVGFGVVGIGGRQTVAFCDGRGWWAQGPRGAARVPADLVLAAWELD